jgi:DNA segregation ATPase FtsK/SpoIIIE-like protein
MTSRWVRRGAGATLVAIVAALAATTPATAESRVEYDGQATAFQTEGLTLTLFPSDADVPAPFDDLPMPPEQTLHLTPDQLGVPSRVGHADFRGVDEPAELPANPLITGGGFRAASTSHNGTVVSEAVIGHLEIAGGALSVENLVARCTGDRENIDLEAPVGSLTGSEIPNDSSIELEPNTDVPVPGLGSVRWNHQITDQKTFGAVSNLVVTLDTELDAGVLQQIPEAMSAFEDTVQQLLSDVKREGEEAGFPGVPVDPETLSGQPLYDELDNLLSDLPTDQVPDLNNVLRLSGSITLSDASCSQEVVDKPNNNQPPPPNQNEPPPGENPPAAGPDEPPLADTGASPWGPRATMAGVGALIAGGALLLLRRRRDLDAD